jgi:hypothetical protein
MATTTTPEVTAFPTAKVETVLGNWYDERMKTALRTPKSPDERRLSGGSVFDIQPELSSQQAVGVLLDLKDCLGYEPKPKKVIKRGGYLNRAEFIGQLCDALEKDFNAHHGVNEQTTETVTQEIHAHA